MNDKIKKQLKELISLLKKDNKEIIANINNIKMELHKISPFSNEPVDCIIWEKANKVIANDYNPNNVAPPEMELLKTSIFKDGYTQPIVAFSEKNNFTVVDGFHRNKIGREDVDIKKRIHGYLPLSIINQDREDREDRIAATIRHNRARGKHQIDPMGDIVIELKRCYLSDKKIGNQLGMEADEILRLSQITGLADMFSDKDFSESWEIDGVDINEIKKIDLHEIKNPTKIKKQKRFFKI